MPGAQFNIKVRTEQGGNEAARERVEVLKRAWPRDVLRHCDALLAKPMPDSTFEALARVIEFRTRRDTDSDPIVRNRRRQRIRGRALRRLQNLHLDEYHQLFQEEWQRETVATNKEKA